MLYILYIRLFKFLKFCEHYFDNAKKIFLVDFISGAYFCDTMNSGKNFCDTMCNLNFQRKIEDFGDTF